VEPHYDGQRYFEGYWEGNRGQFGHNHKWDKEHNRDYDRHHE
jgi:hypothetical protein